MRKLYTTNSYKKYHKKCSEDRNIRRLKHNEWEANKFRMQQGINIDLIKRENSFKKQYPKYIKVIAPDIFSFIKNTDEVIKFIGSLKKLYDSRQKTYVILENIKEVDYSAIVVLLSIMVKFKSQKIHFNGDFPSDIEVKKAIIASGFFDNLYKKFEDDYSYDISKVNSNGIHTHASKNVDSVLSSKLITSATEAVWGESRRCQGVQRTLIELMQNTNNHAEIGKPGEKHWWLSINQDAKAKKVSFSFVDFGVGVFTNLENKPEKSKFFGWPNKLLAVFNYTDNASLLKLILNGDLHKTVTGKHYRGKGLPGIAEVMRRNQISNLHIITNNVFCCPSKNIYKLLNTSFSGTFVYWELRENNESCK